ncbi:major facilitator superfamily transporter [Tritrichomonas foetus]|uniref:Major facilitator superfamily transporter n=1 Tax=Tritrichomonas foetus TaxID=1144522 RepID=A0A1J4KNQ9_9EUKA|nr:major facilitator superfamily transporter [Tritrichomonas foetus]|eukprot:OHT12911.1 major facilitator superfamily transporter [Tritrichomonas foetus]
MSGFLIIIDSSEFEMLDTAPLINGENQEKQEKIWIPLNKRERLSLLHICGIAAGTLVATLLWTIVFTLFEPLSTKVDLPEWVKTLLLFYGSLAGFVINPILGVYSDAVMLKWGRRRIFMVIGVTVLVIGLFLMMYCMEIGHWLQPDAHIPNGAQKGIFIGALIVVFTAGNIVQAPARTLCSDVAPPHQQILMSNIVQVYSGVGGILTNLVGGLELYKYTGLDQEQFILVTCLTISLVAMLVAVIVTPEEPLKEKPPKVNPFLQIWQALKRMPKPFIRILFPFTLAYVATYQFGFQFSHFMGHDIYGGDNNPNAGKEMNEKYQKGVSWSMMCNVVNYTCQFIYGFVNTRVCALIGMKTVMISGLLVITLGLICFFFVNNRFAYLGITVPLGLGNVIYMAIPFTVVSMVIPTEDLGGNLGILTCFGVFGQQVSNFGVGSGFGAIWPDNSRMMIASSCVFSILAMISAFWMITPQVGDAEKYRVNHVDQSQDTGNIDQPFISSDKV